MDPRQLRNALGRFTTGVTIVTCCDAQGSYVGLTANSFNSLSLEPPLVLWSLRTASPALAPFLSAPRFAVNVLAESQVDLSRRFASKVEDRFAEGAWALGEQGSPVLAGAGGSASGGVLPLPSMESIRNSSVANLLASLKGAA